MKIILTILISVFLVGCSQNSVDNNYTTSKKTEQNPLCGIQEDPEDICEGQYWGATFNKKTNRCESDVWGCEDPPFKSVDDCKDICEN